MSEFSESSVANEEQKEQLVVPHPIDQKGYMEFLSLRKIELIQSSEDSICLDTQRSIRDNLERLVAPYIEMYPDTTMETIIPDADLLVALKSSDHAYSIRDSFTDEKGMIALPQWAQDDLLGMILYKRVPPPENNPDL